VVFEGLIVGGLSLKGYLRFLGEVVFQCSGLCMVGTIHVLFLYKLRFVAGLSLEFGVFGFVFVGRLFLELDLHDGIGTSFFWKLLLYSVSE
jgi:hypothetical protein